jgi:hypothetical protein
MATISMVVTDWNVNLQSSTELVIEDTDSIDITEATLYMTKSNFNDMFTIGDTGNTGDNSSAYFTSTAKSILQNAMIGQSVYKNSNATGATGATGGQASITDSFKVMTATSETNIAEDSLLKNSAKQFGFRNAYIAFTEGSRRDYIVETIGMGKYAVTDLLDLTTTSTIANKIYGYFLNARQDFTEFIVGDKLTFLVTTIPDSANEKFVSNTYRCSIEVVADSTTIVPCAPHAIGEIRVASDADYQVAYTDTSTYTNTDNTIEKAT